MFIYLNKCRVAWSKSSVPLDMKDWEFEAKQIATRYLQASDCITEEALLGTNKDLKVILNCNEKNSNSQVFW